MAISPTYPGVYLNASAPLAPGRYVYLDTDKDAQPQPVQVQRDGERLVAHFDDGTGEPASIELDHLPGTFSAA